jgi:phosphoglycerate dehydrogenase-like enzyme
VQSDVILTNTGRSITNIVAGHALAMLYALARNLHHQRDRMRQRQWEIVCGRDIGEMTLGILGFGKIGSAIAMRARPMVEHIYALDVAEPTADTLDRGYTFDSLGELLGACDAIICSLPLTKTTHRLIGREQFERMRRDAYLINISRGEIVDEAALLVALREGEIAGAGIDVLEREPCPPDSELWDEPNLLLTPHSAGFCERLQERKIRQFIENFQEYAATGRISMALDKGRGW